MEIHFEITSRCPLNCLHCSSWTLRGERKEYNIDHICALIDTLHQETDVFLTGGEPLLNEGLLSLTKILKTNTFVGRLGLFTTGQLLYHNNIIPASSEYCSSLVESGVSIAYVSYYGNTTGIHELLTQSLGSLSRTQAAIQNMLNCGIDVRLNVVVFKSNLQHLKNIYEYASEKGISEIRLLKLINHGNALNNWSDLSIDNNSFIDAISSLLPSDDNRTKVTVSGFPKLYPCRPYETAVKCQAGKKLLYVDVKGDVYPCACVKNSEAYKIGNIKEPYLIREYVDGRKVCCDSCLADFD